MWGVKPKEHVAIFALLCIIAFGAGYWHSSPKGDSDERAEVVAPPAPPTVVTNVVTNTLKEVVTNIVTVPQPTPTPTPPTVKPRPTWRPSRGGGPNALVAASPFWLIADPIVEKEIRLHINKPTGELTKADLEKVTTLALSYTKITDAGLKDVAKLQNLTYLGLVSTKITAAGVAELQKALPKCKIIGP